MTTEELLLVNRNLIGAAYKETDPRICFMCFAPLPSKKAFGKTNAFRVMACDHCYKEQYKGDTK